MTKKQEERIKELEAQLEEHDDVPEVAILHEVEPKERRTRVFTGDRSLFSTDGIKSKTMRNVSVTQHSVIDRRVKELTEVKE